MKKHIIDKAKGQIIILAVHLCGTLSIKAVDIFNKNENVKLFALKPCCLPRMLYARRGDVFRIGHHEFDAKDVCSNGSFNKKDWTGPPRWHLEPKFNLWADNLFKGILIDDNVNQSSNDQCGVLVPSKSGLKAKNEISIQVDGVKQFIKGDRSIIESY
eukprot:scaffold147603_cov72-Cyclotella_meneghiniana.AAC.2